jgi:hypothetical protein
MATGTGDPAGTDSATLPANTRPSPERCDEPTTMSAAPSSAAKLCRPAAGDRLGTSCMARSVPRWSVLRRRQGGLGDLPHQSFIVSAGEQVRELPVGVDMSEHDALAGLGELNGEGERVTGALGAVDPDDQRSDSVGTF